jgi:hypothetical protein
MSVEKLKQTIDGLTQEIAGKNFENEHEEVLIMLNERLLYITQFISLFPKQINREELRAYLMALSERDQIIMREICRVQESLQGSLSNFDNVREYLVF